MFIITGGPGVGKTTLLDALLSIVRAKRVRCLLCDPGVIFTLMMNSSGFKKKRGNLMASYCS